MSITSARIVVRKPIRRLKDVMKSTPSPHQRPVPYKAPRLAPANPVTGPSPVPRTTPATHMNFPQPVAIYTTHHYDWYNQITDYVLKLEERIHELECRLDNKPLKDSLAENPWISSDTDA